MNQSRLVEDLVAQSMGANVPANQFIQKYFQAHPQIGSKDRLRIADEFWQALRAMPVPDWLSREIDKTIGDVEREAFMQSIATPAGLDLRVNLSKCRPEQAVQALQEEGISACASVVLPEALHVAGKPNIEKSRAYQQGMVEVQDLGSQVLARLVHPKRGQLIVDFCAGAGGKTLALAAALRGSGKVIAIDAASARLAKLGPRLERSGLGNVWPMAISSLKDPKLKKLAQKADAVLVDAPCSGTGTLRRAPDLKWRLSQEKIAHYVAQQHEILHAAAALVRPKGRLIYATCSLLPSENVEIIDRFLGERPGFARVSVKQVLQGQGLEIPSSWQAWSLHEDLSLWPHRTGTDGFYAAVLQFGASA